MHTSSKNFRTSLFAAVVVLFSLSPTMHAQGSTGPAEAKVPFTFEVGSTHFVVAPYTFSDFANHVLEIRSGSYSALNVTSQGTAVYTFDDCIRDCVGTSRDEGFRAFCVYACI